MRAGRLRPKSHIWEAVEGMDVLLVDRVILLTILL